LPTIFAEGHSHRVVGGGSGGGKGLSACSSLGLRYLIIIAGPHVIVVHLMIVHLVLLAMHQIAKSLRLLVLDFQVV